MATSRNQLAFIVSSVKPRQSTTNCRLKPLQSTLGRLYLMSSFFGHKNCIHRTKYAVGLALWITNLVIHFSFDFYEAWAIFGIAWATCIGMYLVTFVTASICLARVTLPWLESGLLLLHEDGKYTETLRITRILLRVAPIVVVCMGCSGGAGQYMCYYKDGATRLDFNNVLPPWLTVVLNILRFTSIIHMFCGISLFLVVPVCVMIVSQLSMKEFKALMDKEFKKLHSNLSFERAVTLFDGRVSFIRQSSKSCSMMLMILIMSSTLSFTLNCYNFLFVRRLAIYIWFAVLPLLWIAVPLAVAGWATETYQTFAGVVLKNWARASGVQASGVQASAGDLLENETPREGLGTNHSSSPEHSCSTCQSFGYVRSRSHREETEMYGQYSDRKFTKQIDRKFRNVVRPLKMNVCQSREFIAHAHTLNVREFQHQQVVHEASDASQEWDRNGRDIWVQNCPRPDVEKQSTGQSRDKQRENGDDVTSRMQSMMGRFDFERYIIYLQCLLPDVGFSVGGFLISWDKVFALAVFMASLSAVFIQEVLFGSRKNTLGRP